MSAWRRHVQHVRLEGSRDSDSARRRIATTVERPRRDDRRASLQGTPGGRRPTGGRRCQAGHHPARSIAAPPHLGDAPPARPERRRRYRHAVRIDADQRRAAGRNSDRRHVRPVAPRRSRPYADRGPLHVRPRRPRRLQGHLGHARLDRHVFRAAGNDPRDRRSRRAELQGRHRRARGAAARQLRCRDRRRPTATRGSTGSTRSS